MLIRIKILDVSIGSSVKIFKFSSPRIVVICFSAGWKAQYHMAVSLADVMIHPCFCDGKEKPILLNLRNQQMKAKSPENISQQKHTLQENQ